MASEDEIKGDQESQISAQIGQYLSSQYGVLVKILQCLTARDLKNASKVCRSWESAAKKILAAETKLKWLFYRRERGWNVAPQLATWTAMCEHMYFDPDICLCFISKKCYKEKLKCNTSDVPCPVSGATPCQQTHLFSDYMRSFLEPNCRLLVYPVSGVVSCDQDLSRTWEVEYYESKEKGSSAMSTIFFPKMNGVTVVPFSLSNEKRITLAQVKSTLSSKLSGTGIRQNDSAQMAPYTLCKIYKKPWIGYQAPYFKVFVDDGDYGGGKNVDIVKLLEIPENEVVQAVLIFCAGSINQRCSSVLVGKLQERQKHRIAAGGAIVDKANCFEGVVFCGPNVCAASIVLTENTCDKEDVQELLTKLKDCCLPTENSIAFMFACLARGCVWYDNEPNVESQMINKTFPKTPVVGFFGSGEMGVNCLPDLNEQMSHGSRHFWNFWEQVCRVEEKSDSGSAGTMDGEPPRKMAHRCERAPISDFSDINYSYSTSIVLLSFKTAT